MTGWNTTAWGNCLLFVTIVHFNSMIYNNKFIKMA